MLWIGPVVSVLNPVRVFTMAKPPPAQSQKSQTPRGKSKVFSPGLLNAEALTSARQLAWQTLIRIDHEGAFANLVLSSMLDASKLSKEDRGFATDLVYGTTRMRRACDAAIDRFITSEPDPEIRSLLRLGAYQLLFAGTAPHAAVGETVELAPRRIRGFVNAILRRVSSTPMVWSSEAEERSYPDWIVERFYTEMDAGDAAAALSIMNEPAPVTRRADGYFQDVASQWVVEAVGARPGELIFDMCAGPGGKATGIAAAGALVIAADSQLHRAKLVERNAVSLSRTPLGPEMSIVVADGSQPPFAPGTFDRVLLDAPCSGLGALRRRADARWRIQQSDVTDLEVLQARLLMAAGTLVRPGGVLIYSVCTITKSESIDHDVPQGFSVVGRQGDEMLGPLPDVWKEFGSGFRVLPHEYQPDSDRVGSDGMTILRYRRLP